MEINFGSQIRSYVLHPYRMIKDLRTRVEVGDTDRVLDGDIDPFVRAYLLSRRAEKREVMGNYGVCQNPNCTQSFNGLAAT